jgi:hypothetical protein
LIASLKAPFGCDEWNLARARLAASREPKLLPAPVSAFMPSS